MIAIMLELCATICLVVSAAAAHAQDLKICTLAGCSSQVHFPVEGLPEQLVAGVYSARATINGRAVHCDVEVTRERSSPAVCSSSTGAPWVELSLDGERRYIAILGAAPRHLDVSLLLDGRVLAQRVAEPSRYVVFQPNGKGCSPTCLSTGPYPLRVASGPWTNGW